MTDDDALPDLRTPSLRLDGRIALVTGAGRGLGAGAAIALAEAGAEVIAVARTAAHLEEVAERIRGLGGRATPAVCDVTDSAAIRRLIAELPALDILVNNAGTNFPEPFVDVSDAHLDTILGLNVRAVFVTGQAAVRKMLEHPDRRSRGGAVINISSQMGHVGAPDRTAYCMSKHAVEGLTKAMGVELAPHNIRVNSIGPTFIETPLVQRIVDAKTRADVVSRIPMGHLGRIEDIMGAVVYLASPAAALVTGTHLLVDGGWTAR